MQNKGDNRAFYLRKATPEDIDLLFEWVNDDVARQYSFDSHIITYEEHVEWFDRMMQDSNQIQYILIVNDEPVGQIRLDLKEEHAYISYSISKCNRGLGYGKKIIKLAIKKSLEDYPNIKKLIGEVKPANIASIRCFSRNGFAEVSRRFEYDLTNTKALKDGICEYSAWGGQEKNNETESKHCLVPLTRHCQGERIKVLCLYNNDIALELFQWIEHMGHETVLCKDRLTVQWCADQCFDLAVSYTYRYIIPIEILNALNNNVVNLHNSFLPWNRGASPNLWSIVDSTPRGVTLHYMDEHLDKGYIIAQEIVDDIIDGSETFSSSYISLDRAAKRLFKKAFKYYEFWPTLRKSALGNGSFHSIKDEKSLNIVIDSYNMSISDFRNTCSK